MLTSNGGVMVMEMDLEAVTPTLSETPMVKLNVAAVDGVPLRTPLKLVSVTPPGRLPAVTDQV